MLSVRPLTSADLIHFRELRLLGLTESPSAFQQAAEEFAAMPDDAVTDWIRLDENGFMMGAFIEGVLAGIGGMKRDKRVKMRHKGLLWAVYVRRANRRQGIARALMAALLRESRTLPGLVQLQLTVSSTQPEAAALYRSIGFVCFGTEPRALRIGEDFVDEDHMILHLR